MQTNQPEHDAESINPTPAQPPVVPGLAPHPQRFVRIGLYVALAVSWVVGLSVIEVVKGGIKDAFMQRIAQGADVHQTALAYANTIGTMRAVVTFVILGLAIAVWYATRSAYDRASHTGRTPPTAIWSLALGLVGLFAFSIIFGLAAVITGHIAMNRIGRDSGKCAGQGLALFGLVLGYIWILVGLAKVLLGLLGAR